MNWRTGQIVKRFARMEDSEYPFMTTPVLSPNQQIIAAPGHQRTVRIADADTGEIYRVLKKQWLGPRVVFSGNSQRLATVDQNGPVHVWEVATGAQLGEFLAADRIFNRGVSLSNDGRVVAAFTSNSQKHKAFVWNVDSEERKPFFEADASEIGSFSLSPNGRLLACGNQRLAAELVIVLWDVNSGRKLHSIASHSGRPPSAMTRCDFSPDNRWIATGDAEGQLRLWEVLSGRELRRFEGHQSLVAPRFSANGRWLVAVSAEAPCFVWDILGDAGPAAPPPVEQLWEKLASPDVPVAFQAFRALVHHPQPTFRMLRARIEELPKQQSDRFEALLKNLDAESFAVRERATKELLLIAEPFKSRLNEIREKANGEVRARIDQILESMWRPSLGRVVASRALGVLEMIGSPECEQALDQIAVHHPDKSIASEAAESRDRLAKRTR